MFDLKIGDRTFAFILIREDGTAYIKLSFTIKGASDLEVATEVWTDDSLSGDRNTAEIEESEQNIGQLIVKSTAELKEYVPDAQRVGRQSYLTPSKSVPLDIAK